MDDVKGILQSRTVWSALVSVVAILASKAGYTIVEADQAMIVDAIGTLVATVGAVAAIVFRAKATKVIQ